jgi:hypothetical protein
VGLSDDLGRVAAAAQALAEPGEILAAVIPTEPAPGVRIYLCAFTRGESRTWLAFDDKYAPVRDRRLLRDAVSIAAMCELAEETAGGGDLDELRAQLAALRETERPQGIEEAEAAAGELHAALGDGPRIAAPAYLDAIGGATRRLELALGELTYSPFAEAMKGGSPSVEGLIADVEAGYKLDLG